jgi:hypothetical protein
VRLGLLRLSFQRDLATGEAPFFLAASSTRLGMTRKRSPRPERMRPPVPPQQPCPDPLNDARDLVAVIRSHPEQGWSLLCNGVLLVR